MNLEMKKKIHKRKGKWITMVVNIKLTIQSLDTQAMKVSTQDTCRIRRHMKDSLFKILLMKE